MAKKLALLISNSHYDDKRLGHLLAPKKDVKTLAEVLEQPAYGFKVEILDDPKKSIAEEKIVDLFTGRHRDDTVLLYFSGHGLLGKGSKLYLALQQSLLDQPSRASLRASLRASTIKEDMEGCAARRQILLLDCCHSGAFKGSKGSMEALSEASFSVTGRGRAVLAASKSTQQAFEDESGNASLFTRYLVEGLKGEAANAQGIVTLTQLSDYIHDKVTAERSDMTPVAWIDAKEGQFEIARVKPKVVLPESLIEGVESERVDTRLATVYRLKPYLLGKDKTQAESAKFLLLALKDRERLHEVHLAIDEVLAEKPKPPNKPIVTKKVKPKLQQPVEPVSKNKMPWELIGAVVLAVGVVAVVILFKPADLLLEQVVSLLPKSDLVMVKPANVLNQSAVLSKSVEKNRGLSSFEEVKVDVLVARKVGTVFQDRLKDGSPAPKMVVIPAGSFQMGCVSGKDCQDNEKPVHRVTIAKSFALGQTEVTFADYDKFSKVTKRTLPDDEGWGRGSRPVINVSWSDARAYAEWLSEQTGKRYRLPSEAEWEYAVRAGTTMAYSFADNENKLGEYAWSGENSNGQTQIVATKKANLWGLYDVHGNVWEWTEDCWHKSYRQAPTDGEAWLNVADAVCGRRVVRGGSWFNSAEFVRSANRNWIYSVGSINYIGFRLARALF